MSKFAAIMSAAGIKTAASAPAIAAATEGGVDAPTQTQIEAAMQAARDEGVAEGIATGATQERARTNAVLTGEHGKSNPSMAAFLLNANPTASAEAINGHLADAPKPAATGAPAPVVAAEPKPLTHALSGNPKVDLDGQRQANEGGDDGAVTSADVYRWQDEALAKANGTGAGAFKGAAN